MAVGFIGFAWVRTREKTLVTCNVKIPRFRRRSSHFEWVLGGFPYLFGCFRAGGPLWHSDCVMGGNLDVRLPFVLAYCLENYQTINFEAFSLRKINIT